MCSSVSLNVFIRTCVDVYCVCMYIHVRVPWYVCVYAGVCGYTLRVCMYVCKEQTTITPQLRTTLLVY